MTVDNNFRDAVAPALRRRRLLAAAGLSALGVCSLPAHAAMSIGRVMPREPVPLVRLVRHDGRAAPLSSQVGGGFLTAVQLMFTGCSALCPLQGASFAALQAALQAQRVTDTRLLSLSIDPLGDDPKALRTWLQRFGAGSTWSAATPLPDDLDAMLALLGKRGSTTGDRHTAQIVLFDREGRLAWRTSDLPPVGEITEALSWLRAGQERKPGTA